jgi:hypothetical protein
MSKKSSKEKKLRRKQVLEDSLKKENAKFDIIRLLKTESLETKPDYGDFLKKYVKEIRILINYSKITVYPVYDFSVLKIMIDFLDNHQILVEFNNATFRCSLWYGIEEIEITESDVKVLDNFVCQLKKFGFLNNFSNADVLKLQNN